MKTPIEKINVLQNNYGISIEYTLDPNEQINTFVNGMMMHNNIKGVLGYIYESNGGIRKLRYDHPDGIQLSLMLTQPLKKHVILGILSSIADTVCRAEEYMLDESGFIFEPQMIYVNTATLNTDIVYLPTGVQSECNYCVFVKKIIYSSIISTDENTSYIQKIANHINSNPLISGRDLGGFIKSLLEEAPVTPRPHEAVLVPPPSVQPNFPVQRPENAGVVNSAGVLPAPQKENSKPQRVGLFSGLSGKKKPEKSEKPKKPVKASADNGFGFIIPGQSPAASTTNSGGLDYNSPGQNSISKPTAAKNPAQSVPPAPAMQMQQPVFATVSNEVAQPMADPRDKFQDGKTVLLSESGMTGENQKRRVYLEGKNGEKIFITKNMFFIGKADKSDIANDYVIKNSAVSRNHAFLQLTENGAAITDNNSSNGTFVNGEKIPALVSRELKIGDVVRLANEEFVFKAM